jgi:ubiquinone/menaquinone biosynthesis C-methylase UbiE
MNCFLGGSRIFSYRKELLADVQGKILEIGFGTGLNLPAYPKEVKELHVVDPHPATEPRSQRRRAKSPITVHFHGQDAQYLPLDNKSFDAVVSTFTLCSIPNVKRALGEIHRVLRPRGRFYFLEHGLAPDLKVQKKQHRYTPIQKILGDGCHLDRDITALIDESDFKLMDLKKFYHPWYPKVAGFFYQGIAEKIGN